jgi:antitoxin component YwqK of YwqJK toxin-antitoxin module
MNVKIGKNCFFDNLTKENGLSAVPLIIVLILIAIAIPVATTLVQRNQDLRNRADYTSSTISVMGPNGTMISINTSKDGTTSTTTTNTKGQTTQTSESGNGKGRTTNYNADTGKATSEKSTNNNTGVTTYTNYSPDGSKSITTYNKDGQQTSSYTYGTDGKATTYYAENADGSKTSTQYNNSTGSSISTTQNTDGSKSINFSDSQGKMVSVSVDNKGNITNKNSLTSTQIAAVQQTLKDAGKGSLLGDHGPAKDGVDGLLGPDTIGAINSLTVTAPKTQTTSTPQGSVETGTPQGSVETGTPQNGRPAGDNTQGVDSFNRGGGPALKCTPCAGSTFKSKGDANCDGKVDINDIAIWRSESKDQNGGTANKNNWLADFNCDGFVNNLDEIIWLNQYRLQ